MNLEDTLYEFIKTIELSEEEAIFLSEYIQYIKSNTDFLYDILDETKNSEENADQLLETISKLVKGNNDG